MLWVWDVRYQYSGIGSAEWECRDGVDMDRWTDEVRLDDGFIVNQMQVVSSMKVLEISD